jgi:hypothetical protein
MVGTLFKININFHRIVSGYICRENQKTHSRFSNCFLFRKPWRV